MHFTTSLFALSTVWTKRGRERGEKMEGTVCTAELQPGMGLRRMAYAKKTHESQKDAHRRVMIGCRQKPILRLLAASSLLSLASSPMLLLLRCSRSCSSSFSSSFNLPLFKPPPPAGLEPVDD